MTKINLILIKLNIPKEFMILNEFETEHYDIYFFPYSLISITDIIPFYNSCDDSIFYRW